ncbi:hypothetical protein JCM19992_03480 [Thermostilla marina]
MPTDDYLGLFVMRPADEAKWGVASPFIGQNGAQIVPDSNKNDRGSVRHEGTTLAYDILGMEPGACRFLGVALIFAGSLCFRRRKPADGSRNPPNYARGRVAARESSFFRCPK